MTLVDLRTPFVDTRAADLTLSLDTAAQPALATRTAHLGGFDVDLCLLGASHQVIVDAGGAPLRETLACLPGAEPFLPARWARDDYTFRADVARLEPEAMRILVARLGEQVEASAAGLIGAYAGDPLAVTAVRAATDRAGSLRWETWHTYPQSGEVVYTTSSLAGSAASR
ncbi:MAG: DUF2617 family protein [Gordonia sp. (in: high G+C Gram-positive bacteria)]|uniref:DUF2617 family protein n=1 Tax=Gordonia sp. (in: high G+C Gram-positive bacteria) TaxID=84139 RepID=UPI0039E4C5A2